jgi:hypothetical protein
MIKLKTKEIIMMNLEFSLIVTEKGSCVLEAPLGHGLMEVIANKVSDHPSQIPLLDLLAKHPAAQVRRAVASRDCLSPDTVEELSKDADPDVKRELLRSSAFHRWVSTETLLSMLSTDSGASVAIVDYLDGLDLVDQETICNWLFSHPDPAVRSALAEGYRTPARTLKRLVDDDDHEVGLVAQQRLNER